MKAKIISRMNMLITSLLALLGFGCNVPAPTYGVITPEYGVPIEKYGVPTAEFVVQGQVTDENQTPLKDIHIKVSLLEDGYALVYTNEDGKYMFEGIGFPTDSVKVVAIDTDNIYQADSTTVAFEYDRTNSDEWYQGVASAEVNFSLKKNK